MIDLLVQREDSTLGIDLIGHPGPHARALDLERYRMLQRAGLRVFPLSYSAWRKDQHACLASIDQWTT